MDGMIKEITGEGFQESTRGKYGSAQILACTHEQAILQRSAQSMTEWNLQVPTPPWPLEQHHEPS